MSGLAELGNLWHTIQAWLFPMLEDELGEFDDRHREFIAVCEKDSKGKKQTWRGYKLHLDTVDGDLPVSWLLTFASLHDSHSCQPTSVLPDRFAKPLFRGRIRLHQGPITFDHT